MAGYLLRPRARADLDDIWNYTVRQWSDLQAERYLGEIARAIETVATNPKLGRSCDGIRKGYFGIPAGSHIIYYRSVRHKIEVVRVLHQRMDVERHL